VRAGKQGSFLPYVPAQREARAENYFSLSKVAKTCVPPEIFWYLPRQKERYVQKAGVWRAVYRQVFCARGTLD
jgi:hypothetical protein